MPQGNFLRSLTPPKITRQRAFKLTDNEYDKIKDGIVRMEYVECNTAIGRNIVNVDDIEDFSNL